MGVQFVRVQSYGATAKKGSKGHTARAVIGEALREPEHCPHVERPQKPKKLFGDLDTVRIEAERLAHEGKAEVRRADGRITTRKIHGNAPVLAAYVFSYPGKAAALTNEWEIWSKKAKADRKTPVPASFVEYRLWEKKAIEWARELLGDRLDAAVTHWDEGFPHIHVYALAKQRPDGVVELDGLHPGRDAKEAVRANREEGESDNAHAKRQKKAYCDAMKAMQDSYWKSVGEVCGHARLGPQRCRLSPKQWAAEKKRNRRHAQLVGEVELQKLEIAALKAELQAMREPPELVNGGPPPRTPRVF